MACWEERGKVSFLKDEKVDNQAVIEELIQGLMQHLEKDLNDPDVGLRPMEYDLLVAVGNYMLKKKQPFFTSPPFTIVHRKCDSPGGGSVKGGE